MVKKEPRDRKAMPKAGMVVLEEMDVQDVSCNVSSVVVHEDRDRARKVVKVARKEMRYLFYS